MNTEVRRQLTQALAALTAARLAGGDLSIAQRLLLISATQELSDLQAALLSEALAAGELD